jgi:hypothetical protein
MSTFSMADGVISSTNSMEKQQNEYGKPDSIPDGATRPDGVGRPSGKILS